MSFRAKPQTAGFLLGFALAYAIFTAVLAAILVLTGRIAIERWPLVPPATLIIILAGVSLRRWLS